ncbi:MAG TPA: GAF domain-containing sensor histidine kinase [Symbiobacteriaceae bacterium]|nr:GAF domain-containing sensor histidine kinase [Symbiobacteriaceae bacterium]
MVRRSGLDLFITLLSLLVTTGVAFALPLLYPVATPPLVLPAVVTIAALTLLMWATQPWRVALRGARGDVSISMALDVAAMLLLPPYVAASGSAFGTALYHLFHPFTPEKVNRIPRALVRGIITFAAVGLGGWLYRSIRPGEGPLLFGQDWFALAIGIGLRLVIRVIFYPLGMAALRRESVAEQLRYELNRLPLLPFLLTTTLGTLAALIAQSQPVALVLLLGPLATTYTATREFKRLNELLATLEDKVADRTARLAETVAALKRRLQESEALYVVDQAMISVNQPDELLSVICRESVSVTGGTSALITLPSEDGTYQIVRAVAGGALTPFLGIRLVAENSLAGLVMTSGQPHVSRTPRTDPLLNQGLVDKGSWEDVIEAPLRAKDKVLGVLVVGSSEPNQFDEQDIRLLTLLANQAGIFLQNARLQQGTKQTAVLEERNRLARELHDSVTQVLFGLTLNLESAAGLMERRPERAAELITRAQEMAAEALAEMRSLIFELRPSALQEKGLAMALTNHVNLFRRRQDLAVTLQITVEDRLDPDIELCLYRVAQEALHNVTKHAKATHVLISYRAEPGAVTLTVADDGVGIETTESTRNQSFGMIGMKERVEAIGGRLTVTTAPGEGTTIQARIPMEGGETDDDPHSAL